ncbi:hypothetical protein E2562_029989 [Oryza meyeriana var. granulata]|uniref:Uncharacterized protein n=1 Tax=Oryza meyeriana var. granulata TaxID=110450 RepID=A0A6G1ER63_9ORYZ|nr:hypothetical protein E2562_029989 [Oryza meyeriana var. granulata]
MRLESALAEKEIKTPRIPVISSVDASPHSDPDRHDQEYLAWQVTSPVQWEKTVKALTGKGLEKSYGLDPGKVIAGILKRITEMQALRTLVREI